MVSLPRIILKNYLFVRQDIQDDQDIKAATRQAEK